MSTTKETMDLIKQSHQNPSSTLSKSFSQGTGGTSATGLTYFDLQAPAKLLFPFTTPLRNVVPRVQGRGDIATRWKTILTLNSGLVDPGVSEGNRGAAISDTVNDVLASYVGLGLENFVTFEADYAAENFDDAKARATQSLLLSMMEAEEKLLIGGNNSVALGVPAGLALSAITLTSTFGNSTQSVYVVALTLDGFRRSTVAGGIPTTVAQTSQGPYSNTVTRGGGSSNKSSNQTQAITGTTQSLKMSCTAVKGAWAYAWFWGTAGNEVLGAITTVNTFTASAAAAGTQNASAITVDNSKNAFVFDGISSIVANNSTSYFKSLDGAALTSDGAAGVAEIETALQSFWDNYRIGPSEIWVSSQEQKSISKLVLANGSAPLVRFTGDLQGSGRMDIAAGSIVTNYINRFMGESLAIKTHPFIAPGTILFKLDRMPPSTYQYSNVGSPLEVHYRRDYYQIDWPQIKRQFEFGVYADEVLACYAPFGFGMISNAAAA